MKGSEKQIKWAEDIKINVLAIIADAIAACEQSNVADSKKSAFIAQMNAVKHNIETVDYAGDLISVFAGVKHTNDYKDDLANFKSALRINDVDGIFSKGAKK